MKYGTWGNSSIMYIREKKEMKEKKKAEMKEVKGELWS